MSNRGVALKNWLKSSNLLNPINLCVMGLVKLRQNLKDVNAFGPVWLINFEDIDDEEEKERVSRDAYERVNTFLNTLGIGEFKER